MTNTSPPERDTKSYPPPPVILQHLLNSFTPGLQFRDMINFVSLAF